MYEDEGSGSYGSPMEHEREAQGRGGAPGDLDAEGQWQKKELSNITLQELEKHYDVPLIEVAKKLSVSLTMLKKLCRKHGITRWPHRQIRSIANNIEELKGRYLKCQSENERRRLDEQIEALHKKRRLVYRSASCGLNAALRNAIFQARPGELDEEVLFDQGLLPNLKAALSTKKKSGSSKASSNSSGQQSDGIGSRSFLPDKRKRDEDSVFQNPFQEPADLGKNFSSSSQLSMSSDTPSDSNHPAAKVNVRSITPYGASCVETSRGQGFPSASPSYMQCPFDMASTTSRAQQHYPHMLHMTNQQPGVPSLAEQNMRYSFSGTGAYHSSVPQSVSNRQQNHFLMLPMDVFQHLSQQHPPLQPPAGNHPFHQIPHLHQLARAQHQDPSQYAGPQQTSLPSTGYGFRSSHNILMHDAESVRQQHQDALLALSEYSPLEDMFDTADDTYEYDERLERSLAEEYRQNVCSNTIQPVDSLRCDSRTLDLMSMGHFRQDLGVDNSDISGSMEPSRKLAI